MKILDIITEAPAAASTSALGPVLAQAANGQNLNTMPSKGFWGWIDTVLARKQAAAIARQEAEAIWTARVTWVIKPLFYLLQLAEPTIDALMRINAAEQLYVTGAISKATFQRHREWYLGIWEVQILMPLLVRVLRVSSIIGRVAKVIVTIIGSTAAVAGAPATFGASLGVLAGVAAEQAFLTWLTWWLGQQEARDWIAKYLAIPVLAGGRLLDGAFDDMYNSYKKADEKKAKTPQTGAATNPDIDSTSPSGNANKPDANAGWQGFKQASVMHTDPKTGKKVSGHWDDNDKFIPDPGQ